MKSILSILFTAVLLNSTANAGTITYDTWTTNEGSSGNYIVTIDDNTAGKFNYTLNVNPWNAEALGIFFDLGDVNIAGPVGLSGSQVSLVGTDTSSNSCGAGCNLNGLNPPVAAPDGQWELVFRLGTQGFNNIQSFSWQTNDFGLSLSDFGLAGVRAQNLCTGIETLPTGSCKGSDKSYGTPEGNVTVPEPSAWILLLVGLSCIALTRKNMASLRL